VAIPPDGAAHLEVTCASQAAALLQREPAPALSSGGSLDGHDVSVPVEHQRGPSPSLAGSEVTA
jgi:hypothetical protein